MTSRPIQVLILESSQKAAEILSQIISLDPNLKVMSCLYKGKRALTYIQTRKPDVIVIDTQLLDMDGFEATRQIMESLPIPIIIVCENFNRTDVAKSYKAIEVGAIEIIEKPSDPESSQFKFLADTLIASIKKAAIIQLTTRRHFSEQAAQLQEQNERKQLLQSNAIQAIAIGASLGGPTALKSIFSQLPPNFPIPILVVLHIAAGFNKGFVDWIQSTSSLHIKLAEEGEGIQPGYVYIAPENRHLEINLNHKIHLSHDPPEEGLRPSVSRLFRSMAEVYGKHGMGIILTGMGHDGAAELLLMKSKGALTIAQSKESCFIFGMPKEAISIGGAQLVLSLEQIIEFLTHFTSEER